MIRKVGKPLFQTFHLFDGFDRELRYFEEVDFQILGQAMSAHNVIDTVPVVRVLLWEQIKVEQIDGDGRAEALIVFPFPQSLIHPRPVVKGALLHIITVHQLNLDIDLTAVTGNAVNIELREFVILELRVKFPVDKGDVRETVADLPV